MRRAEDIAGQAWETLTSVAASARDSTRSAGRRAAGVVEDTSSRVGTGAREARRRANAAMDALAGRRPRTRWEWFAVAGLVGAALPWLASVLLRRRAARTERVLVAELPDTLPGPDGVPGQRPVEDRRVPIDREPSRRP